MTGLAPRLAKVLTVYVYSIAQPTVIGSFPCPAILRNQIKVIRSSVPSHLFIKQKKGYTLRIPQYAYDKLVIKPNFKIVSSLSFVIG